MYEPLGHVNKRGNHFFYILKKRICLNARFICIETICEDPSTQSLLGPTAMLNSIGGQDLFYPIKQKSRTILTESQVQADPRRQKQIKKRGKMGLGIV